jgi:hypothetical protein
LGFIEEGGDVGRWRGSFLICGEETPALGMALVFLCPLSLQSIFLLSQSLFPGQPESLELGPKGMTSTWKASHFSSFSIIHPFLGEILEKLEDVEIIFEMML